MPQVLYEQDSYEGQLVSRSKLMTSVRYGIVPIEYFSVYAANAEINVMDYVLALDSHGYYMMNIIDYLVGNSDRHWGNWGLLVDNASREPIRLHDLMDFNRCFESYDDIDGGPSLTGRLRMTKKDAAIEAVSHIGVNQKAALAAGCA